MGDRADRIDSAVASAGELIAALQDEGPITGGQARVIIEACVRAVVGNAEPWEIRASAQRVSKDLERESAQLGLGLDGGDGAPVGTRP
jgi:hypothetical protein